MNRAFSIQEERQGIITVTLVFYAFVPSYKGEVWALAKEQMYYQWNKRMLRYIAGIT